MGRSVGGLARGIRFNDAQIDYKHEALGGCFGRPDCLVVGGYDIVGDNYTGFNTPVPDDDPYDDCGGHGTHVAGIIAAQPNKYGFTGAAPGVKLTAYRVFGCDGSAANDVLIDAYMRAHEDGADIITASIGGPSGWSENPWSVVVSRIAEAGVPCTVSAGNDGDMGLFYASTAADGKKVTAVASFDNWLSPVLLTQANYTVDGGEAQAFGYAVGTPDAWAGVTLPLWTPSFNTSDPAMGCEPYPADTPDLSGKIVLVRRGTCLYTLKVQNAVAAGAKYVMFYNNVVGAPAVTAAVPGVLAIGMAEATTGEAWAKALEAGSTVELHMADPKTQAVKLSVATNDKTGGFASTYTSWGPTYEADIKPQLAAPGGQILSTYPVALGSYAVLSGTSMSCPLVAAIYALVANVRGTTDPEELQKVLSATSKPNLFNDGVQTYGYLAPVAQQGAGMIQAYDAAYLQTLLSTSGIAFNDTDHLVDTRNFTIFNTGKEAATYNIYHAGAGTGYTFSGSSIPDAFPGVLVDTTYATLAFSESKVTIPAGGSHEVTVTVTPPAVDPKRLPVYSGYIAINGSTSENLSLPYQGIAGSLHATQVLDKAYLALSSDADLNPVTGDNSTFTLTHSNSTDTNATLPVAVVDLAFGSPLVHVELEAISAGGYYTNASAKTLGDIFSLPQPYLARGLNSWTFTGQLADESFAPAGRYRFAFSAMHIFGDATNPADFETQTSAEFTIRYV